MNTSGSVRVRTARRLPAYVAALACTVGALTVVHLGGTGAADATTPATCTTVSNPLGAATGWTEFVETDGSRGAESEGAIAYGGSFAGSGFTVGSHLPVSTPASTPTLVVAGSHGSFNLQRGSAYVTPQSGVNFNGGAGTGYLGSNPVDFDTAFAELRDLSGTWGAAAATGTVSNGVTGGNQALVLTGESTTLNVFDLTAGQAADLAAGKHVGYDVPGSAVSIINVPGSAVTIAGQAWVRIGGSWNQVSDGNIKDAYNGIVWNFPSATSITLDYGSAWAGHVLAPRAALAVVGGGHNIGQVITRSFSSQLETHFNLFPSTACVPGPPSTPDDSDVRITKTASVSTPQGGDFVTYTLLVENVGDGPATGVVVEDALPAGVTFDSASAPCTLGGGTVTCAVGTLAAHTSTTLWIKVVAHPVAGAGSPSHPQANHWLTPYKVEQQVDLEDGEQRSVTLSCRPGDILSDGQFRIDHVDQDTGTIGDDVTILSSQLSGLGLGTWKGVVRNDATGRAQAKAFIVCLPAHTDPADRRTGYDDSHEHPLSADPAPVTATATYGAGVHSATLTCPTGTIPVAPGFDAPAGGVELRASEYDDDHPRDWVFTLGVDAPAAVTLSVRCLRTTVGPVHGHTHELKLTHVVEHVTVSGRTAEEGDEFQVICPDDGKGVVATWDLPPGVQHFGNDPRLKERAFRIFNDTGRAEDVTLDLLCLRDRTSSEDMGTNDPVVVPNVATVTSASADANAFNNSSTATITVQPGSSTTSLLSSGRLAAGAFSVKVASSMPGRGTLSARAGGTVLATGTVGLEPGRATTASLRLTAAGKRQLGRLDKVTVRVDPTRGRATSRSVRVVR
jgi:choice-of-anchor A domain-containing protein/uncharacterized repeat protein (TIGR01451 family)